MHPSLPRGEGEHAPPPLNIRRKRQKGAACATCRSRKVACNGARPACSSCAGSETICQYPTKDESETRHRALMRENKTFSDLIDLLKNAPPATAQAVFYELRAETDPDTILQKFEEGQLLKRPRVNNTSSASLPRLHCVVELRLMLQLPTLYPVLDLSYDAVVSKNIHVNCVGATRSECEGRRSSVSSCNEPRTERAKSETQPDHNFQPLAVTSTLNSNISKFMGPLMQHLRISYWTNVPVTDRYAAAAISLYLESDHQMLRLFDAELFLNDLIHLKNDYCSPFLLNSILAMASQTYSEYESTAAERSHDFAKEAILLWRTDRSDTLTNLAGLMLLYVALGSNGKGDLGATKYISEACEMAKRMRLFGVEDTIIDLQQHLMHLGISTIAAQQAFRQTTWGVFNAYNCCVRFRIAQPLDYPPKLSTPDSWDHVFFNGITGSFDHASDGLPSGNHDAFRYACRLCFVDSGILVVLRNPSVQHPASLGFAYSRYSKLLEIMGDIPQSCQRTSSASVSVLYLHTLFHQCVSDLFRPYAKMNDMYTRSCHPSFGSPRDVFRASTQQLKGLVLEYTSPFRKAFKNIVWHTALLYTANAVLEDISQSDWRFFFLLSIHCYARLSTLYPMAESAVQSLLCMAITSKAISASDATNIIDTTLRKNRRRNGPQVLEYPMNIYATDLALATSDRETAATASLAKKFEEISLYEEFTKGIYGTETNSAA